MFGGGFAHVAKKRDIAQQSDFADFSFMDSPRYEKVLVPNNLEDLISKQLSYHSLSLFSYLRFDSLQTH